MKNGFLAFILFFCLTPAKADIELSGIVLDRTISRFGKDFVFYFSSYWREVPATDGSTIVVYEQIYPQAGTFLWVELDQRRIYQNYFGRRQNDVKQMAEQAILVAVDELVKIKTEEWFGAETGF
ncbi:curli production assembly/transport protein CsgE [Alishewanella sp. d11]|uniref:curli production assembly/transport protein CsgE n=1 Tax=Alishewanella sp. d11 TaxID=3414030 RepID=UPI003BF92925